MPFFAPMLNTNLHHKSYLSYGLKIASFVPLTGLITSDLEPDTFVLSGSVRTDSRYSDFDAADIVLRPGLSVRASRDFFFIEWDSVGACLIESGTDVTIEIGDEIDEKDFIPLITGPILAVLLHQRGQLVLHASAVNIDGRAVVFLGAKGSGKSTLAAHLQQHGHELISDDIVPVSFSSNVAETIPGYPQIRLFPDSVESIGFEPGSMPQVNTWIDKRHFVPDGDFTSEPIELGCIFILGTGESVLVQEVNPYSAFIEIADNTYTGAFLKETDSVGVHFELCERLVKAVPVLRLSRPHDFGRMQEIIEMVTRTASECAK